MANSSFLLVVMILVTVSSSGCCYGTTSTDKKKPFTPPPPPRPRPPPFPFTESFEYYVQGLVYCQTNPNNRGNNTLSGAKPLKGADLRIICTDPYQPVDQKVVSGEGGYFQFHTSRPDPYFVKTDCNVYLIKSPSRECSKRSNFNGGISGAPLVQGNPLPSPPAPKTFLLPNVLFQTGPFAFSKSR
ncbi:non-classical arabinogalactan protein 31-like [Impatiens glandulifera]|uniref:non-classical arabinogalactan protein 31-like n=1 Tax=Impatiens glandulifera TaxID=253017 RepID=UPI001FB191DD|nr:non-classical arabinogalactan protein 31-like [Impatiens glandulifera]